MAFRPTRFDIPKNGGRTTQSHRLWAAEAAGQLKQKALRICLKGLATDVNITLVPPQGSPSSAQPNGWAVSVVYAAAPDTVIFDRTLSSEKEAQDVYDDIVKATAEVEGLLRQEKTEDAQDATDKLLKKYAANSSNPPSDTES